MGYRVLTIYPALYRLRGRARVSMLRCWAEKWDREADLQAPFGKSAEDAWLDTSPEAEYCMTHGIEYSTAAIDLYKAFDVVTRALVYWLLCAAGFPG
eukprot:12263129-Alexandrium_andersonii.AAC.1